MQPVFLTVDLQGDMNRPQRVPDNIGDEFSEDHSGNKVIDFEPCFSERGNEVVPRS
ncbi:MAG: hypothetical protein NVSMB31_08500 [Vulcanimicrobiaceae bacterium]